MAHFVNSVNGWLWSGIGDWVGWIFGQQNRWVDVDIVLGFGWNACRGIHLGWVFDIDS